MDPFYPPRRKVLIFYSGRFAFQRVAAILFFNVIVEGDPLKAQRSCLDEVEPRVSDLNEIAPRVSDLNEVVDE